MILQTQIRLKKQPDNLIDYQSKLLLLGSCFVENIGNKFSYFKFQSLQNPFGVLFHPKAIENLIVRAVQEKGYHEDEVFFHNEQWHCYGAHSLMSHSSKDILIENLNEQLQLTRQNIEEASHIVMTLGTAWVYKHIESNVAVANCHKVAQHHFNKELLSIKEITAVLQNMQSRIKEVNKNAILILTVSPVRHVKDGFVENTLSKAHLIAAIHAFIAQEPESGCFYFPSYEIMMDELRDYRFYKEDMLHPNVTAINYIWEKFQQVWLSGSALEIMEEVDAIQKGMAHRSFQPNSEAHTNFLKQLSLKKKMLHIKFPHVSF